MKVYLIPFYIEIKHKCYKEYQKYPSDKINVTNNWLFISRAPTYHSFTSILRFLYEPKHQVRLSKSMYEIFQFDYVSFLLKFIFYLTKSMHYLTLKRHIPFKTKIIKKSHILLLPDLWFWVLARSFKIKGYLRWLKLPKTEMKTNFLNLENRKLEYASFSQ